MASYDVFISFRGDDTRSGFTSHLYEALCRSYCLTYIDYRIEKGNNVWEELVKAIKKSTLFLVVFSDDYASSAWCLNELVEIMECHKNEPDNVVVIPVFYKVEPSQVRKQTGSYATAFAKHMKKDKDKIQKWKDVLSQAADLSGFPSTAYRSESVMIEEIARVVLGKLNHKHKNEITNNFILDENYRSIESLVKIDSAEVQVIGLWGMGGIGKTTLAAAIFQKFSIQYEGSCFFENVTDESKRHGINYVCNKLLSKLLREDLDIDTLKVIPSMVMTRLKRMKAFIVLDDVHTSELLQNLIGVRHCWLGAGSTVIVTTRDNHVLKKGGIHKIHQVKEMNSKNSLQLFSLNAFDKVLPKEGYMDLSKRAIDYAKGNPLALKVLGSFLCSKNQLEWNCALAKLKEIPNAEIDRILRWSYNELDEKEKNIFLDIACFLRGHERNRITKILNECGFFADIGIRHLLDKALIRVDSKNCIQMHDLIQEMGKQIVREESLKTPGHRSRLCDLKEGTETVEAIILDATEDTHINLSPKAFAKMLNLRLLAFRDHKAVRPVNLPQGLDLLPENLRYFLWDGYPCKSLPPTFCPEMLVELFLRYSQVEKLWDGVLTLPNLEILDVKYSQKLIECPNVSGSPNLKEVDFSGCVSLLEVDSSIFLLQKLENLSLRKCTSLKILSSNTCSPALLNFDATNCINLQEFSVSFASVDRLCLSLPKFGTNELPSSILHFKNLWFFDCPISESLVNLPENFAMCIWLVSESLLKVERDTSITLSKILPSPAFLTVKMLIIDHVSILSEIPDNISLLSSLEFLSLNGIAIRSLPESIKYLPQLESLDVYNCNKLQSIPALSQFIPYFTVCKCESLEKVLSSTNEPSDKPKCGFILLNCIKLDPRSYQTVLKDAIAGIELGARLNSENEDPFLEQDDDIIEYFLPAMSGMENWSRYRSTQVSVTLEFPSNLLGFAYYLVLSQGHIGYDVGFGCECYLDNSSCERIHITSLTKGNFSNMLNSYDGPSIYLMMNHLVLWYDPASCEKIMEAVEEIKAISDVNNTSYNPKLTFRFFIDESLYSEVMIVECGFHWIYPFEGSAVPKRNDGFDSDDKEEAVLLTNKLEQCVVGTQSNLEVIIVDSGFHWMHPFNFESDDDEEDIVPLEYEDFEFDDEEDIVPLEYEDFDFGDEEDTVHLEYEDFEFDDEEDTVHLEYEDFEFDDSEDISYSLERLLHIGFDGDMLEKREENCN
ncbi:disease resistance protein RUN1 isoform X2 [Lathyrus oleraceus]|uniref:disease resistance protein RUN1 isoform X2 n=1 Tax=Pisum sativum TaxID=3888 RepID=UPI0021D33BD2|nr:disease resistance protein RUN1-like isoform X2 [Pisum sativum]